MRKMTTAARSARRSTGVFKTLMVRIGHAWSAKNTHLAPQSVAEDARNQRAQEHQAVQHAAEGKAGLSSYPIWIAPHGGGVKGLL